MNLDLNDRIALVTGGSKGIGAAIVKELAREGVKVICAARSSNEMDRLVAEIQNSGGTCVSIPVDLEDASAVSKLVKDSNAQWGGLDILINNVGGAQRFGSFEELSDEDWLRSFNFNVMSMVRVTRAALPFLRKSSLRRVINVSSISAIQPGKYNPHYACTKAAVVNLSKHLSLILAPEKILVNTICPGPVHSESWMSNVNRLAGARQITPSEAYAQIEQEESSKVPLGMIGESYQIAAAAAFLASPLSSWTTGTCFHINGGKLSPAI